MYTQYLSIPSVADKRKTRPEIAASIAVSTNSCMAAIDLHVHPGHKRDAQSEKGLTTKNISKESLGAECDC
jgi:hypothetical protein